MKKTKVVIPALGILLLSTAASVTGTVAWFSSNASVDATGMKISAKSDSKFLIICADSWDNTARTTTITRGTSKEVYPVAPAVTLTADNIETPESWHYAYSESPDKYQAATSYTACDTLTDYVGSETYFIGLNNTSGIDTSENNIVLRTVTLPADTGISAVVVGGNKVQRYDATSSTALDLGVKATKSGTQVKIYYFIDGENPNVYSENAASLTGSAKFVFDVNAL